MSSAVMMIILGVYEYAVHNVVNISTDLVSNMTTSYKKHNKRYYIKCHSPNHNKLAYTE